MKLKDLEQSGGFVSPDGVRVKGLTWKNRDGEEFTFDVIVKQASYGTMERILMAAEGRSRGAITIAECLLFGDAGEQLSYEQAYALDPGLARVFMTAINGIKPKKTKEDAAKN